MNRRDFLAAAASTIVTPIAAAVVTTKTVVTNSAWTDLGAGPMLLSFRGEGVYAIGDTMPSLTDGGFTIKKGDSLSLSTNSHVWVRATSNSGVSVYASSISGGGGGGSTSVWSAADAAANGMTLSNGGLTVTTPNFGVWQTVRTTTSKTSGKVYIEFLVSAFSQGLIFGMANAGFNVAPSNTYLGSSNYSAGIGPNAGGVPVSAGFTANYTSTPAAAAGDVWALAIDFAVGSIWIAQNNVWVNASNPATGSLPIVSFVPATVGALFAAMSFINVSTVTLQSTAASQKYSPPSGFSAWDASAPTHSPQALAYLARTVGGNEGGNGANIATLIDGLVSDGVWSKLDALWIMAQQNAPDAHLNLVGTSYPIAAVGNMFIQYAGFDASVAQFSGDTGFDPTIAPSSHFTQNSASFGFWSFAITPSVYPQMGQGAAGAFNVLYDNFTGNQFISSMNSGSDFPRVPTTITKGLFTGDRSSPTNTVSYQNGAPSTPLTSTSGTIPAGNFIIGYSPNSGGFTDQTLSAAFIGGSLGSAGQLALYNRLRTYLTAIGVP